MPVPNTKVFLASAAQGSGGYRLLPQETGDFLYAAGGAVTAPWVAGIGDLDGDGLGEVITGVPGSNDQDVGAGRIYVTVGRPTGGPAADLDDATSLMTIDGARANDHAGSAIATIADLTGDGLAEILVGAPLAERGTNLDAGFAYVVFGNGTAGTGIDLNDLNTAGSGEGYAIRGEAAGDRAGQALASAADLNGDGRAEVLVGAVGSDAGGVDSGAAYVVWGRATDTPVNLSDVAAGTGGWRIAGQAAGDAAGSALASIADLNGDGKAEILVGAPGNDAGGAGAGAAYVVFGKANGTAVSLNDVAAGVGGFRITGAFAGEQAGTTLAAVGDVNADGKADILLGAPGGGRAHLVYGKAGTAEVRLSDVALGLGGYAILPEAAGDLAGMQVTGGADLNRDGVDDLVIGAPRNAEGGASAGAVYVVWGGGNGTIDLSLVAQGAGGAKIVGQAGSLAGSSVALLSDMNGDGTSELAIGAPGGASAATSVVYAPASWQPDPNVYGTNGADSLAAGAGGLHPIGAGTDSIYTFGGSDSVVAESGADSVDGGSGDDTLAGGDGLDSLAGGVGTDSLLGGLGDDSLDGGTGRDTMAGGVGNDTYAVDVANEVVQELAGEGSDTIRATVSFVLPVEVEALQLLVGGLTGTGGAGAELLLGSRETDTLLGAGGADTLTADAGNDSLDGGTGTDSLAGGAGNDAYAVDTAGDVVSEALNAGTDTVTATLDWTLGANLEALVLAGAARTGTGNDGANTITGAAGDDTLLGLVGNDSLVGLAGSDRLSGGTGTDTMAGGDGNDTYLVDAAGDLVVEAAGAGSDTVLASVDTILAAQVEALVLTGAARSGIGNAIDNTLTGTTGDDTLDGAAGADSMAGGAGHDRYIVDNAGDVVSEATGAGIDTVQSSVDVVLGAELEVLVLTGAARHGTGNGLANAITGTSGADSLDGAGGADTLTGGAGDDAFGVDSAGDIVVEAAGGGVDTVYSGVDYALGADVEALVLTAAGGLHGTGNDLDNAMTGGAGADSLEGGIGQDTLDGGGGPDSMAGGVGDDSYLIADPGDVVVETVDGGFDTVIVSTDWTLGENIEAVQLLGAGRSLTGNAAGNVISGNSGDDTLDGAGGDDTQLGGDGDDLLVSTAGRDTLSGGSGDDRFEVHGGSAHIEDFLGHDTLDASEAEGDSSIDLSGETISEIENESCDLGQGGAASGPLDVMFLQDLTGSFADDIANVRLLVPDIVAALEGVQPDSTFGVSTFRDKAVSPFGGPGDWVYEQELALTTDTAALTAAYGAMVAGNGADGPEAQLEALMQLALHTTDLGYRTNSARFVILFTDAPFHVAGDGALGGITTPNDGDAVLDGTPPGTGEDYPAIAQLKVALEAANIIPIFCVAGGNDAAYQDLVTQLGRGSEVTLSSSSADIVTAITEGLTAATVTVVEDCWGGAGDDSIRGNDAANGLEGRDGADVLAGALGGDTLKGGAGSDTLDGGAGADSMTGEAGDDLYVVDDAGDVVAEILAEGRDTVSASVDWTLGAELEALVLTGAARIGTGNTLNNAITGTDAGAVLAGLDGLDTLTGGIGADLLDGGAGNDSLIGGGGADAMTGGLGNDTYIVDEAGDTTVELAGGGLDLVLTSLSWTLAAQVEGLTLVGAGTVGTGNAQANRITGHDLGDSLAGLGGNDTLVGGSGADLLDGGAGADSLAGGAGDDTYVVGAVTDTVAEAAGGGLDTVRATVSVAALHAEVENLVLLGGAALSGAGNALGNAITGNLAANLLAGLAGADTVIAGGGDDTIEGGLGADRLAGGVGADLFRYASAAEGGDTIVQYRGLEDTIQVSAAGFGGGLFAGMNLVTAGQYAQNTTGAASTVAGVGQFVLETDTGLLWWDADGIGVGAGVVIANITGAANWAGTEITIVA